MADYWRSHVIPAKRPRLDYEDVPPPGAAYLPLEDRYEERDNRFSWRESESLGIVTDLNRNGLPYSSGGMMGMELSGLSRVPTMSASGPWTVGAANIGVSLHDDPSLFGQGGRMMGMDVSTVKPANMGLNGGRPSHMSRQDNQAAQPVSTGLVPADASSTLFVEGLPSDCSRREAAHVFRPFVGFKEVRLVRKDAKRPGGDQFILCFVDFVDSRCAATALEALQGYKFDEAERDSDSLRLQFARNPGPRSATHDGYHRGRDRAEHFHNHAI